MIVTINDQDITLPQSWNELSLSQQLSCYAIIMSGTGWLLEAQELLPAKRILLVQTLLGLDEAFMQQWKADCVAAYEEDGELVFLAELDELLEPSDFLFDIIEPEEEGAPRQYQIKLGLTQCPWPRLVREKKGGKKKYYLAPTDGLENISFYELCTTFTHFENFLDTKEENHIDELLATLYRPHKPKTKENKRMGYQGDRRLPLLHHEAMVNKRKRHMASLPQSTKQLLTFWFASCRQSIIENYDSLFSSPIRNENHSHGWGAILLALAGSLQNVDAIAIQPFENVLTYLSFMASFNVELKKS